MKKLLATCLATLTSLLVHATSWTYDGSASQKYLLDDSGWKFKITLNRSYTLNGTMYTGTQIDAVHSVGGTAADSLDFSSGIPDGLGDIIAFNGTFYVSAAQAKIRAVTLPETLVYIGGNTFRGCTNLETITPMFNEKVQYFGNYSLQGCSKLMGHLQVGTGAFACSTKDAGCWIKGSLITEATLGDGVSEIPSEAFRDCSALAKVTLGANLTKINAGAFRNCGVLETVVPLLPSSVSYIGNYAFNSCKKLKGHLRLGEGASFSMDASGCAFSSCEALQEVTFGTAATTIAGTSFRYCYGLTNVNFSTGVATINDSAFRDCTGLTSVTPFLPETVTYLGQYVFGGCKNLTGTLTLGGGETGSADISWQNTGNQFSSCGKLNKIVIGAGVTTLPANCFANDFGVTEVEFFGFPTWASSAFGQGNVNNCWKNLQARFLVPSGNADWIAFMGDSTKMASCTDAQLATYATKYGTDTEPRGVTKNDGGQFVVVKAKVGSDEKPLQITGACGGAKFEIGTVVPAYGEYEDVASQLPLTISAPQYADVGNTRYECQGYEIAEFLDEQWVNPVTNAVRSFEYNPSDTTMRQVKWLWKAVAYKPAVSFPSACGSVEATAAWADGFYTNGTVVTFAATPAAGYTFGGWYGSALAGGYSAAPAISVAVNGEFAVTPYFAKDWELADDGKSISDGYWTIPVEGAADHLTVKHPTIIPALALLDLRKPVTGGTIVAVADAFAGGQGTYEYLTELRLPDTLTSIGGNAFRNQVNLKKIYPSFPDSITFYGFMAFAGCSALEGDIKIGMDKKTSVNFSYGSGGEGTVFQGLMHVDTVTLGPGVHTVPASILNMCENIKEITVLGGETEIRASAFRMFHLAPTPQTPVFRLANYPTNGWGTAPFQNWWAKRTCVYLPSGNAQWAAWMGDSTKMTPWANLSTADQQAFSNNFSGVKNPKGLSVEDNNTAAGPIFRKQWIFTWNPNPVGLAVILR